MPYPITFYILDVFAEAKYEGNQLAVMRGAGDLSTEQMQKIAKEMNYSESTFILSDEPRDGGYDVRIFTPDVEVPFAGHPTLGTACLIRDELLGGQGDAVTLNLKVGKIPVELKKDEQGEVLWMQQIAPSFDETLDRGAVAPALGLEASDIDERFPVQAVSTGLPFFIVPLRSIAAVKKARVDRRAWLELVETTSAKAVLIFAPETYDEDNDINARVFADYYDVPEDPATGSANGCLAGYLARHRFWGKPSISATTEQGYEIGRPSLLRLEADDDGATVGVRVGGRAVLVARGELV